MVIMATEAVITCLNKYKLQNLWTTLKEKTQMKIPIIPVSANRTNSAVVLIPQQKNVYFEFHGICKQKNCFMVFWVSANRTNNAVVLIQRCNNMYITTWFCHMWWSWYKKGLSQIGSWQKNSCACVFVVQCGSIGLFLNLFTNNIEGKSPYQDTQDTSFNRSIKQGGSAYCDTETKSNLYFHLHDISKQNFFFKGRNQKNSRTMNESWV